VERRSWASDYADDSRAASTPQAGNATPSTSAGRTGRWPARVATLWPRPWALGPTAHHTTNTTEGIRMPLWMAVSIAVILVGLIALTAYLMGGDKESSVV